VGELPEGSPQRATTAGFLLGGNRPIACDGRLELAVVSVGCVVLQKLSGIIRLGIPFWAPRLAASQEGAMMDGVRFGKRWQNRETTLSLSREPAQRKASLSGVAARSYTRSSVMTG
jgi:hypothetical protein